MRNEKVQNYDKSWAQHPLSSDDPLVPFVCILSRAAPPVDDIVNLLSVAVLKAVRTFAMT